MSRGGRRRWFAIGCLVLAIAASGCGGRRRRRASATVADRRGDRDRRRCRDTVRPRRRTSLGADAEERRCRERRRLPPRVGRAPAVRVASGLARAPARAGERGASSPSTRTESTTPSSSRRTTCATGSASASALARAGACRWSSPGSRSARRWRSSTRRTPTNGVCRRRAAVYAIFPVDPFLARSGARPVAPRETRVLLLVGDRDDDRRSLRRRRTGVASSTRCRTRCSATDVIRTTDDLLADHEAPTYVDDPVVRRRSGRRSTSSSMDARPTTRELSRAGEPARRRARRPRGRSNSVHSIAHAVAAVGRTKLETRPRPFPSATSASRIAHRRTASGDVVDAEADVMEPFAVLRRARPRSQRSPSSGSTSWRYALPASR